MNNRSTDASQLRLVYLIGTYPGVTTTFVDREIKILRQWGADLQIVAMRRPAANAPLSNDQRALQTGVIYLLPASWLKLLLSHLRFMLLRPCQFFGTMAYLVTRPHPNMYARLKTLCHFSEGVYAAYLLRERAFQELHAHFVDRAATIALVAGRLLGKPYSLSIHAGADIYVNPVLLPEKLKEARHAVTCTLYNRAHLETLIGEDLSDKVSYVHHGLELANYQPAPVHENGTPVILSVGQLVERKGFVQLIHACRTLREQGHLFHCEIVGGGPQHEALQDLVDRLGLDDMVTLWGALPHEQVIAHFRQATLFVLPCLQTKNGDVDGIPNVLAEAMAMEVPVISTVISAVPELVIDHQNGLLVPSQDHEALVAAIEYLLTAPAQRAALTRQGRLTVTEQFDVERNVRRFATTLWPAQVR